MPNLTEAAERVRNALEAFQVERSSFVVHDDYPDGCDYDDDCDALAKAYAAEMDPTPVDEEWLRKTLRDPKTWRLGCYWLAGSVSIEIGRGSGLIVYWNQRKFAENPTRGLVRTLKRIGGGM